MKTHLFEKTALLVISDGIAILLAFVFGIFFGYQMAFSPDLLVRHASVFFFLLLSIGCLFFVLDGYSLHKMPERFMQQVAHLAVALLISSVSLTFVFFFVRNTVPRLVFLIFYSSAFLLMVLFRRFLSSHMLVSPQWRALIVGDGKQCLEFARIIDKSVFLRTVIIGYLSPGNGSQSQGVLPRLGGIADLESVVNAEKIDQVIFNDLFLREDLAPYLVQCLQKKIKISEFRVVIEEITGKVPIDYLNEHWFIDSLSGVNKRYFWYQKRTADLILAVTGLCLVLPFFPFLALLIKLDSPGPIFYKQQRRGRGNVPFNAWKLRTMTDGADRNNVHWTLDDDERITRLGRFIRKTHVDEVPQLLNILKGEMSLIGPRPEALSLVEKYEREIPFYNERLMVTPGITGWAQINFSYGNSIEDTRQKLSYDFYYIKYRSITLDLAIFLRTIRTVLTGKGAL